MPLPSPARLMLSLLIAAGCGVPGLARAAAKLPAKAPARSSSKHRPAAHSPAGEAHRAASHSSPPTTRNAPRIRKARAHVALASSAPSAKTAARNRSGKRAGKNSRRQKGQMSPTTDRISQIQQALAKDGSFAGDPTGKWDDGTVQAMKHFQEAHGLNPTGKVDAKTLQQLGLGSSTAGLAPPMPAATSSLPTPKPTQTVTRQLP